jgi:phospholipid/cholesterol/gamma-HCH transport system ATP-binding protein
MGARHDISTHHLDCGYGDHVIIRDVNVHLPAEKITCILGPSGCGKSTLLRTLLLLEAPLRGEIHFGESEVTAFDSESLTRLRRKIGVSFQGSALFNSMTLLENVVFPLLERTKVSRALASKLALLKLDLVGLARFAHYLPSAVSGGMRRRCGIARALALDPPWLFLDEPSAGLDPVTAAELDALIIDIRDRLSTTVVVVTHELPSIRALADHIVLLGKGEVVTEGSLEEIEERGLPEVDAFFGRRARPRDPVPMGGIASLLLPEGE